MHSPVETPEGRVPGWARINGQTGAIRSKKAPCIIVTHVVDNLHIMSHAIGIFDSEWELMNGGWGRTPIAVINIVEELAANELCYSRTTRTQSAQLVKNQC